MPTSAWSDPVAATTGDELFGTVVLVGFSDESITGALVWSGAVELVGVGGSTFLGPGGQAGSIELSGLGGTIVAGFVGEAIFLRGLGSLIAIGTAEVNYWRDWKLLPSEERLEWPISNEWRASA